MPREHAVIAALTARGADRISHPGGNLVDHLVRTSELLRSWGAERELVLAGLAHAAYGTDRFPTALFRLDERTLLADLIGDAAEAIVHRYASCDRGFTYPRLASSPPLLRDRFAASATPLDDDAARTFAELTVANELDVVGHSDRVRAEHGEALRALFGTWHSLLRAPAIDACRDVLGPPVGEPVTRHVVVDGIRLAVRCWGSPDSPPIVLLHGGGLQSRCRAVSRVRASVPVAAAGRCPIGSALSDG